jgi:dCMP deaminase
MTVNIPITFSTSQNNKIDDITLIIKQWNMSERIKWDEVFMCLAYVISARSPCNRLHVGCVFVKNKRVVSMGYNGFLTGEEHHSIVKIGPDGKEHEMATVHAEQNTICYGANTGVSLDGTTAYITHYPCLNCAKLLESSGITKIFYHEDYNNDPLIVQICTKLDIKKI